MNDDVLLTTAQVSERLRVEVRTVSRWLRAGSLRGHKAGRTWRIAPDDLERFLEGRAHKARTSKFTADAERFEIRIRTFEFQPIEDASYLKVRTYPRPTDCTVRLGVIEWITARSGAGGCKLLVNRKPMSHDDAMAYAKRFAAKFLVPVIYQREDDPATP